MGDIKNALRTHIVDNFLFGNPSLEFSDGDSFMEKGILDSTGILSVISYIEENFDIKVEDNELVPENLDSVNNLVSYIKRKKGI